jgi:hypothetical protein
MPYLRKFIPDAQISEKELQEEGMNTTTTGNLSDGMPPGGNEKSELR